MVSHNYATTKIDSYDSLPLEKNIDFEYVITIIKFVFNKDQKYYYYIYNL